MSVDSDPPALDYDRIPESRRDLRPPTVDERVRDLEVAYDARAREMLDMSKRIRTVEAWPSRLIAAVLAGSLGVMATVIGGVWSMATSNARMETAIDALTARVARVEDRLDRMEERSWTTHGRTTGGE